MDVLSPPDSLDLLLKALKSKKFTSLDVSYTKVSAAGFMISSFLLGPRNESLSLFPPNFLDFEGMKFPTHIFGCPPLIRALHCSMKVCSAGTCLLPLFFFFYLFESYLTQYIESRFICFTYWAEISWKLRMVIGNVLLYLLWCLPNVR